jgi:DNA replication factor GINS
MKSYKSPNPERETRKSSMCTWCYKSLRKKRGVMLTVFQRAIARVNPLVKVRVRVKRDLGHVRLEEGDLTLLKDSEVEVPWWLVEVLGEEVVEPVEEAGPEILGKILFHERQTTGNPASLQELPPWFPNLESMVRERIKSSKSAEEISVLRKAQNMISEIRSIRRNKLVKLASLGYLDPQVQAKLTKGELLAFRVLAETFKLMGE